MKFATYYDDGPRIGIIDGARIWDLQRAYALFLFEAERSPRAKEIAAAIVPTDLGLFIRLNHGRLTEFAEAIDLARASAGNAWAGNLSRPLDSVRLLSPLLAPSKIVCCGNSYAKYLEDWGLPKDEWPQDVKISFLKPPTALIGQGDTILFPPDSEQWDYENELAIVIGKTCSNIREDEADAHIFGYSILNDACVRDIPSWTGRYDSPRGKACDTFAPFGPCIVPAAYLGEDPNNLALKTTVDGEVRQSDRTAGLLWRVQRITAFVSRYIKLLPGDILSTGSSTGNALVSGKWLRNGQTIRCEMQGIGVLENRIGVKRWRDDA